MWSALRALAARLAGSVGGRKRRCQRGRSRARIPTGTQWAGAGSRGGVLARGGGRAARLAHAQVVQASLVAPRGSGRMRKQEGLAMATVPRVKITYATLTADNTDLHAGYEAAVQDARGRLRP